jgi:hypothetical protein
MSEQKPYRKPHIEMHGPLSIASGSISDQPDDSANDDPSSYWY